MADQKRYLRAILGEARESLAAARVGALSQAVQRRLIQCESYRAAPTVVLYAAAGNEVATALILEDALASGRRIYFPRLDPARAKELVLVRVHSAHAFIPGRFGIAEPTGSETAEVTDLGPALICVPGLAFTFDGRRLGRGGGHYDRMLARAGASVVTTGLAYSFQVLDKLPESPHDWRLEFLVTESAVYRAASRLTATRAEQGGTPKWLS